MTHVRIHDDTKKKLEYLAGLDYSIDDVINILLERTIPDEDEDEDQLNLLDFDEDEDEE